MHGYEYGRPPPPGVGMDVPPPYGPGGGPGPSIPPPPPPISNTMDPMGDPYLEGSLPHPPSSQGGVAAGAGPIDTSHYTLTSLDNEAWMSYPFLLLLSVHLCAQCLDPFFIIVKEALCDTQILLLYRIVLSRGVDVGAYFNIMAHSCRVTSKNNSLNDVKTLYLTLNS